MNLNAKAYNGEVMFTNEERTLVTCRDTETYEEVLELTADVLDLMKHGTRRESRNQPEESDSGDVESGRMLPKVQRMDSPLASSHGFGDEGDETENNASGDTGEQQGDETAEGGEDGVETKGEGTMESAAEGEDDGSTAEGDQQTDAASDGWTMSWRSPPMPWQRSSRNGKAGRNRLLQRCRQQHDAHWYHRRGCSFCLRDSQAFRRAVSRGHISQRKIKKLSDSAADLRPTVNAMAMAFARKQAAPTARRTQVAKSGRLDEQTWQHKLTEDIFLKTQQRPDGKNHALTVVIDCPGSMNGKCRSTIKQAVTLAMLQEGQRSCEVYLFWRIRCCLQGWHYRKQY